MVFLHILAHIVGVIAILHLFGAMVDPDDSDIPSELEWLPGLGMICMIIEGIVLFFVLGSTLGKIIAIFLIITEITGLILPTESSEKIKALSSCIRFIQLVTMAIVLVPMFFRDIGKFYSALFGG